MEKQTKIVGLGGSMAAKSGSLSALKLALEGAQEAGAETELFAVGDLQLPMYAPEADAPEPARRLAAAVHDGAGMIWSSPLYHGTVSGAFKNALDWLQLLGDHNPPYLTDKVVGMIGVAGGTQALQAVNTMEFVVRALRGWAVPLVRPLPSASEVFDSNGQVQDPDVDRGLRQLGGEVVRAARQFASHGYCDYSERR